jgi:hypothetical protein
MSTTEEIIKYLNTLHKNVVKKILISAYEAECGETNYEAYNFTITVNTSSIGIKNPNMQIYLYDNGTYYVLIKWVLKNLDISFLISEIRKHKLHEIID